MLRDVTINIDLYRQNYSPIKLKQSDTTKLTFNVFTNGVAANLTGHSFVLNFLKADSTLVIQNTNFDTTNIASGIVKITLVDDCTRVAGSSKMELQIKKDGNLISNFSIDVNVECALLDNTPSQNKNTLIEELNSAIDEGVLTLNDLNAWLTTHADITNLDNRMDAAESSLADKANISYVNNQITSVSDGTPEAFTNLAAIQAAYPTGNTHVKLNLADGYVYKWNGSSWVQGWVYQSTGFADDALLLSKLSPDVKNAFLFLDSLTGFDISGVSSAAPAPSGAFYLDNKAKAPKSGYIKNINIYAKATGTVKFYVGSISGNVFTKRAEIQVTISQTGNLIIPVTDFVINKDEYLGLCATSGNILGFNGTSDPTALYYYATTNGTFTSLTVSSATNQLYYNFELAQISNVGDNVYTKTQSDSNYISKVDKSVHFRNMSDELLNGLSFQNMLIGEDISGVTSAVGGAGTGSLFINANSIATKNGYISNINIYAKATGTVKFYIGTIANSVFTPRTSFTATIATTGQVKLMSGTDFTKIAIYENEYLGIYTETGTTLGYSPIAGNYYYKAIAEPFTTASLSNSTANKLFYSYNIDYVGDSKSLYNQLQTQVSTNTNNITDLGLKIPTFKKGVKLDEINNFTTLPTTWHADAGWTLGSQATSSTANSVLYTDDIYGVDNRIMRWEFEITSSGVVDFATVPAPQRIPTVGSVIRVSSVDNSINFMTKWTDGTDLSILKTVPTGFNLLNERCIIEIEKDGRNAKVRLWQVNKKGYIETSRANSDLRNYEQGCLQGKPQVILRSGAVKIYSHKHVGLGKSDCLLYIVGDSITEGRGVLDTEKYGRLLQNYYGREEVIVSGIGGACLDEAYLRIVSETEFINPKNVLINLGTNTAAWSYMQTIVDYFIAKGSNIFICTLPAVDTYTANILALPYNIVRIELAMKDANGVNIPDYYPVDDTLHPNTLGNVVMFNRIIQDMNTKLYE